MGVMALLIRVEICGISVGGTVVMMLGFIAFKPILFKVTEGQGLDDEDDEDNGGGGVNDKNDDKDDGAFGRLAA
jgi:hypothetical protein